MTNERQRTSAGRLRVYLIKYGKETFAVGHALEVVQKA